jgi:hypothetical protein
MLGMGTFWLDFVHERMTPRIDAVARLSRTDETEARMAVLSVNLKEV